MIVKPARLYFVNVHRESEDLRLLHVDIETMFVMSASGRIERQSAPDRSPGPRVFFAGCPFGNIARVRYDIDDRIARKVLEVAATEPPWRDPDVMPRCAGRIVELLSDGQLPETHFIYRLPNRLRHEHTATIVRGDSADGRQMLARLAERGMPDYILDAGFKGIGDFWEPWCVALEGTEIASMAFAARLGEMGAEVGVYTFPKYRRAGLAAAVTASWASMPALNRRALF
ncbi:MAG TPA: hypothetical protein VE243_03130, partial [Candidatus Acidoferrum sp.]|nr:hypothetical protein [Candidatus Acidoferrum sp.]